MRRVLPLVSILVFAAAFPSPARSLSCGGSPEAEAVVGLDLSAIEEDVELSIYGRGDDRVCHASLWLSLSKLASRSLVPRPREIAEDIAPAARSYGAETCAVTVWFEDDGPDADPEDPDQCWTGVYRYDGDFWRAETEDDTCW
jgi:hypothetical protein